MTATRIRNIKQLAVLAGVSAGTVSRALAGSELISRATRERVQALAAEHDFRPSALARNLRARRTGAIGVLIPLGHEAGQLISDPFFITMLGLLADALTERGYDLLLSRVIPAGRDWLTRFASSGKVDGLIVIGQSDQFAVIEEVARAYHPLVVWGGYAEGQAQCSVGSDNVRGGELAAAHLVARGCRRITFLGDSRAIEIDQRLKGVRAAMARAGLADQLSVFSAHFAGEAAYLDIERYLAAAPAPPEGIVAVSEVIAMSAIGALARRGLTVPADVKVIGYDGLAIGEHTVPPLTTISQDVSRGAAALVDLLLRRIAGEDTARVVMEPVLVVRGST